MSNSKQSRKEVLAEMYRHFCNKKQLQPQEPVDPDQVEEENNSVIAAQLLPEDRLFVKQIAAGIIPRVR